jgi:hypothetical protein
MIDLSKTLYYIEYTWHSGECFGARSEGETVVSIPDGTDMRQWRIEFEEDNIDGSYCSINSISEPYYIVSFVLITKDDYVNHFIAGIPANESIESFMTRQKYFSKGDLIRDVDYKDSTFVFYGRRVKPNDCYHHSGY